jgi:hypothetical protein
MRHQFAPTTKIVALERWIRPTKMRQPRFLPFTHYCGEGQTQKTTKAQQQGQISFFRVALEIKKCGSYLSTLGE